MVWFLARHEWRVLVGEPRSCGSRSRCSASRCSSRACIGASRAGRERATIDAFDASRRHRSRAARPSSLRADAAANERGWLALLPPAPLSALAIGQGDVYPNYIKVTARSLDALVSGDQIEHPLAVASGQFDVAFVILFLYPLLIFAVSFDLTATERDQGTLRMVLAQPVTLGDVVAGKMIVRALTLLVARVVHSDRGRRRSASPVDGDFWLRAALWSIAISSTAPSGTASRWSSTRAASARRRMR